MGSIRARSGDGPTVLRLSLPRPALPRADHAGGYASKPKRLEKPSPRSKPTSLPEPSTMAPRFLAVGTAKAASVGTSGRQRHQRHPTASAAVTSTALSVTPTFKDFVSTWLAEHQIRWRRSHIRSSTPHWTAIFYPHSASVLCRASPRPDVLAFRAKLADKPGRTGAKLSNKRINNISGCSVKSWPGGRPLRLHLALRQRQGTQDPQVRCPAVHAGRGAAHAGGGEGRLAGLLPRAFLHRHAHRRGHGLKWKYVDFERRIILIRETFVLGEDEYTKTDSSQRDIQMSQPVFERSASSKATGNRDYVFCNRAGQPIDNKNFSDRVYYPCWGTWAWTVGGHIKCATRPPRSGWPLARRQSGSPANWATRTRRCCSRSTAATCPT